MSQPVLHGFTTGEGPEPLYFLHGLFGQGKNFGTIAKALADVATSTVLDMPNHGRSPWTDRFDYDLFADLVAEDLVERGAGKQPITLVGHSMGGKVAMRVALLHPQLLKRLVIVDVSPVDKGGSDEFTYYADQLMGLDLARLTSRSQADQALAEAIPNAGTRAFLLQNLHRDPEGGWRWLPNLALLRREMDRMSGWPEAPDAHWDGPVLWVAGERSSFISPQTESAMRRHFPNVRLEVVAGAGHWVHADQPQAFTDLLRRFLAE